MQLTLETLENIDGRKKLRGQLVDVKNETIVVMANNKEWTIPYSSIRRAKLVDIDEIR